MRKRLIQASKICAMLLPLTLASSLAWWGQGNGVRAVPGGWSEYLHPVVVSDVSDLERVFAALDYSWPPPPGCSVPRISVEPWPADYDLITDAQVKKSLFFRMLLPMVLAENSRILKQREFLDQVFTQGLPPKDSMQARLLEDLRHEYRVPGDLSHASVRAEFLRRVDVVPAALVLAQAANESGWGTSRFARMGNNLFGVWTYLPGQGMVPESRAEGATHAVRMFTSLRASIRSHLRNLNIGHAYEELRQLRAQLRAEGGTLDSLLLADGLDRYSSRGMDYIVDIQTIIRANHLRAVRTAELCEGGLQTVSYRNPPAESRGG